MEVAPHGTSTHWKHRIGHHLGRCTHIRRRTATQRSNRIRMEHMINAVYDALRPAVSLVWAQAGPGVLISGRYKIVADRFVQWENDLYVDGEWYSQASTVDRLKQVAANLERRNGYE